MTKFIDFGVGLINVNHIILLLKSRDLDDMCFKIKFYLSELDYEPFISFQFKEECDARFEELKRMLCDI